MMKIPYSTFFLFDGAAALVELPVLVYGVRFVGGHWEQILEWIHAGQGWLVGAVLVLLVAWWLRSRLKRRPN